MGECYTGGMDMSEQPAPSDALWGAEEALKIVFERSGNPMVLFDGELHLLDANNAASEFLQTPREGLRGRSIREFSPPDEATRLPPLLGELLAVGHLEARYETKLPDGSQGKIEFSAVADILPGRHLAIVHRGREEVDSGAVEAGTDEGDRGGPSGERSRRAVTPSLSQRELEVLQGFAMGIAGRKLGDSLGISYETVRVHARNARRKLGARTQAHAIALALKRGWISSFLAVAESAI